MAINIADNMGYNGKKPLDGRTEYATLSAMKAVVDANINEGCLAYNKEDGKYYKFLSTNTVDATTGKWREFETGGGGQTYNDFTGATASTAGAHGLVPAPSAGDEDKVLFGNGAWGALPSVDLSVLSNEAFIFSETEKPVGMWTDRKILYAKTIIKTGCSDGQTSVAHGISNIDEICFIVAGVGNDDLSTSGATSGTNRILFYATNTTVDIFLAGGHSNETANITLFYTKTTDSPLPSDVKFAGVTSDGRVKYERTVTGILTTTNAWVILATVQNFGKLINAYGYLERDDYVMINAAGNSNTALDATRQGELRLYTDLSGALNKEYSVTFIYTLAS